MRNGPLHLWLARRRDHLLAELPEQLLWHGCGGVRIDNVYRDTRTSGRCRDG
jgi:hypothetical protein